MTDYFSFSFTVLSALMVFSFVSSITPGPNNLMLLYSGARFGFEKTIPHLLGVSLGFGIMLTLCCLGIAGIFWKIPYAQEALKVAGSAYMLWLAYKLWVNGALPIDGELPESKNAGAAKPMTFMQAAMFQYVNPKAWVMALSVPGSYLPNNGHIFLNTAIVAVLFTIINLVCVGTWAKGGSLLQKLIHRPAMAKAINIIIVLLTIYCAVAVWL